MTKFEARSTANRPDIKAHLTKLKEEKKAYSFIEYQNREYSRNYSKHINYDQFTIGSTCVPLEAAVIIQRETQERKMKSIINREDAPDSTLNFSKYWSSSLYPMHTMTSHGALFPTVLPLFYKGDNDVNTRVTWVILSILSRVDKLCQIVENIYIKIKTSEWYGWGLVYLARDCFNRGS